MLAGGAQMQEGVPARWPVSGTQMHSGKAGLAPTSWRGWGFRVRPSNTPKQLEILFWKVSIFPESTG